MVYDEHSGRFCQTAQHGDAINDILIDTATRVADYRVAEIGAEEAFRDDTWVDARHWQVLGQWDVCISDWSDGKRTDYESSAVLDSSGAHLHHGGWRCPGLCELAVVF